MNIDLSGLGQTAFSVGTLNISVGALLFFLAFAGLLAVLFLLRKPAAPDQPREELTELLKTQTECRAVSPPWRMPFPRARTK